MLISAKGLSLKNKNKYIYNQFIPYKMLQARWKVLLLNSLKASIKKHLKNNKLDSNDPLTLFSDENVLNAFFKPLYYINWYVFMGQAQKRPSLISFAALKDLLYLKQEFLITTALLLLSHTKKGRIPLLSNGLCLSLNLLNSSFSISFQNISIPSDTTAY